MKKIHLSIKNFIMIFIAGFINSVGIVLLLSPLGLFDSGLSGLSMFLNAVTPKFMKIWMFLLIFNLPIFLFAWKKLSAEFTIYSVFSVACYAFFAFIFENVIPTFYPEFFKEGLSPIVQGEVMLAGVFGGLLSGIGSGLTIRYGGAMDGIDAIAVLFAKKIGMTIGNFVLTFNIILYLAIGCYYQSYIQPLYSVIAYFVASKAIDFISDGLDQAKGALIITTEINEIASALSEEFGRGLTIIDAKGYYSDSSKQVIYCVVNRFQIARLRSIISEKDSRAFVTIMDISDVLGTSIKLTHKPRRKNKKDVQ